MKINIKASLFSMLGAVAGAIVAIFLSIILKNTAILRVVWVGMYFSLITLGGGIGLHLYLTFTKKYDVSRNRLWILFLLVSVIIINIVGSAGQYLFMLDSEKKTTEAYADIVLLLDCSGSMSTIEAQRAEASAKFIDYLDEDFRLQVVPFGSTVFRYSVSELLEMNDTNKTAQKNLINSLVSAGQTDFEEPFEFAYDTLVDNKREGAKQVVMILSDGLGKIPDRLQKEYEESDIFVYSLRFEDSSAPESLIEDFVDFVESTDGFDVPIAMDSSGSVDKAELEKAFENVFVATVEYIPTINENLLVCAYSSVSIFQHLIRFITFALCSAVVGIGYFAQFDVKGLLFNAIIGAVAALIIALFEGVFGLTFCCVILSVLLGTAIVSLQEKQIDGGYYYNV